MIKKSNKRWGSPCLFWRPNADKYGYLAPFDKNARSPKLDKKERFFRWCIWYRIQFDFNVLFIHLRTRKRPSNTLVFTLRAKVDLNWARAIRPVIAQAVQFRKIAKKLNIELCQFFSSRKEALSILKSWNKKWGVTVLVFAAELQKVRTKCIFSDFWERTGASFKMACMWKGKESNKKIRFTEFKSIYHS